VIWRGTRFEAIPAAPDTHSPLQMPEPSRSFWPAWGFWGHSNVRTRIEPTRSPFKLRSA